jgi:hypothetical protein
MVHPNCSHGKLDMVPLEFRWIECPRDAGRAAFCCPIALLA